MIVHITIIILATNTRTWISTFWLIVTDFVRVTIEFTTTLKTKANYRARNHISLLTTASCVTVGVKVTFCILFTFFWITRLKVLIGNMPGILIFWLTAVWWTANIPRKTCTRCHFILYCPTYRVGSTRRRITSRNGAGYFGKRQKNQTDFTVLINIIWSLRISASSYWLTAFNSS